MLTGNHVQNGVQGAKQHRMGHGFLISRYTFRVSEPPIDPRAFRRVYLETIYHAAGTAFTLSSKPTNTRLFEGRAFGLITAANPFSTALSAAENRVRNEQMQYILELHDLRFGPSLGTNRAGNWMEHGFIIWDVPETFVLNLGQQFDQNAIVYGVGHRVALAWCVDQQLEWFFAQLEPEGGSP
jgi:hypothetical protein